MASLSLQGIQKIYPNGFHAVKDFNLEIADKEFIIFVGPSGRPSSGSRRRCRNCRWGRHSRSTGPSGGNSVLPVPGGCS